MIKRKTLIVAGGLFATLNATNSILRVNNIDAPAEAIYVAGSGLAVMLFLAWGVRDWRTPDSILRELIRRIWNVPIPRPAKDVFLMLLAGVAVHIAVGRTTYPFADVGMFRYAKPKATVFDPVLVVPKYYFRGDDGQVRIVELRKQHIPILRDMLGFGFNNEYTFSATYHYKGLEANYEFLLARLREARGIDTLWVGLHKVDYRTGEIRFDPDPVRAIEYNDTANIYYGPLWVPKHQRRLASR